LEHSQKILAQQVVSACLSFDVERVVISPGSRNAPLIIEFNAFDNIKKYSIVDERSAAFFALGMAQKTRKPVALVCSSGSAMLNYYPAIAEAFYSKIPLVVITADRPKHLIDIGDGQTIRQEYVYQNHICFSANLDELNSEINYDILNTAFDTLKSRPGPIHLNVPFDEPLYKTTIEHLVEKSRWLKYKEETLLTETPLEVDELEKFAEIWNTATRKMVLLGVSKPDAMLQTQLEHIIKDPSVIVLTENTSNVTHLQFINSIDQAIFPLTDELFDTYRPEILLTFGGMVVSKKIKQLLRKNPPKQHWHVDRVEAMNTYHCLTKHFAVSPTLFFSQFFFLTKSKSSDYQQKWLQLKQRRALKHQEYIERATFSDLKVFDSINRYVPEHISIQFSNSSIIRYAQLFTWSKNLEIACNRGTSGIDGSTSTAVGVAVANKGQTLFITGDLSFFYDSNALWNSYIPTSFRIIVINNGGGGIFRFIPGPTTTHTLDYFETPHQLTAENLCKTHQISYESVSDIVSLEEKLRIFFNDSKQAKLLEIFTPKETNAEILKAYFNNL
jgi:2-succinyl-5-enolpyruvyl-6-hydroxy-3-cyclohexene-1-carboxylate synthase